MRTDAAHAAAEPADGERLEVLVVDDDSRLLRTLADILRHKGFDPQIAASASEGLALVERAPEIAIAIVDLSLPDMNAPVSMPMRLLRTIGSDSTVWPCTITRPRSRVELKNGSRIHSRSSALC